MSGAILQNCRKNCRKIENAVKDGFFDKEEHLHKVIDDTINYIKEVFHESCVNSDGFDRK